MRKFDTYCSSATCFSDLLSRYRRGHEFIMNRLFPVLAQRIKRSLRSLRGVRVVGRLKYIISELRLLLELVRTVTNVRDAKYWHVCMSIISCCLRMLDVPAVGGAPAAAKPVANDLLYRTYFSNHEVNIHGLGSRESDISVPD